MLDMPYQGMCGRVYQPKFSTCVHYTLAKSVRDEDYRLAMASSATVHLQDNVGTTRSAHSARRA